MQLTVTDMMRKYNKENQLCSITLYRWDRLDYLKSCMKWQKGKGLWNEVSSWRLHGKEHARAKQKGYQHQFVHPKRLQMLIMIQ
jgi:hypothetical protein